MKTKYTIFLLSLFNLAVFAQNNSSIILPNSLKVPAVNILPAIANSPKGSLAYFNSDNKVYYSTGTTWKTIDDGITIPYSTTQSQSEHLLNLRNTDPNFGLGILSTVDNSGVAIEGRSGQNGVSVLGSSTGDDGSYALLGENLGNGTAVRGANLGVGFGGSFYSSNGIALQATAASATGTGVHAQNSNSSGYALRVNGKTKLVVANSSNTTGKYLKNVGNGDAEWANPYVYSYSNPVTEINFTNTLGTAIEASTGSQSGGSAIRGVATHTNQTTNGVFGVVGVNLNAATNGLGGGVYGVDNANGAGVYGVAVGVLGAGVRGYHAGGGTGGDFYSETGFALKTSGKVKFNDRSGTAFGKVLTASNNDGTAIWSEASAFGAYSTSTIPVASGVTYVLKFPEQYEKNMNYNPTTGIAYMYYDGIHHFDVCVRFDSPVTGVMVRFFVGNSYIGNWIENSLDSNESIRFSFDYYLNVGDAIKFDVSHTSPTTKNITSLSYVTGHLIR